MISCVAVGISVVSEFSFLSIREAVGLFRAVLIPAS